MNSEGGKYGLSAKVVKVGHATGSSFEFTPPDATKRYFVSVMPDNASFGEDCSATTNAGVWNDLNCSAALAAN